MSGLEATLFQPKLEEQQEHPRDLPSIFECFKQMSKRDYPRATRQQDLCMFKTPSLRCRDCTHWPPSNVAADMPIRNQRHNGHDVATEISAHTDSTYLLQYILWIIFVWFHFSIKTGYLNLYLNLCNIYIITSYTYNYIPICTMHTKSNRYDSFFGIFTGTPLQRRWRNAFFVILPATRRLMCSPGNNFVQFGQWHTLMLKIRRSS